MISILKEILFQGDKQMKRIPYKTLLAPFIVLMILITGISMIGGCDQSNSVEDTEDEDEESNWFRELRTDSWSLFIGDDSGILSVIEKLETMYAGGAPDVKIDLANKEFSEGNWHYEFNQMALQSIENSNYLAATGYYCIASYPQMYEDELSHELYAAALETFEIALQNGSYPYKIITVTVEGVDINTYLVCPQSFEEGDSVPVVIETGGIDSLVLFNFSNYMMHWNEANIAWLGFDIPGMGTSKDLNLTYDAEKIHIAVLEALRSDNSIDNKNIFINGRSMGGYVALRVLVTRADDLDIGGIIAFCPIAEHIFSLGVDAINAMDPMMRNTWGARLGINPANTEELADERFRFSYHGLWGETFSSVPLLIYNSGHDFLNPVYEMEQMAQLSENGFYIIADEEYADEDGHCGCRKKALEIFAEFVDNNLRLGMNV
jgi:pimeloyl-ACP methyl ester carboxylesterase